MYNSVLYLQCVSSYCGSCSVDTDVLDATHESLVPLEEEEEEEEDHSMELDRDHLMDTVASLAHGIGRAHRQRGE